MKKIFFILALTLTGYAISGGAARNARLDALARTGSEADWQNYKNEILSDLRTGNITNLVNDWRTFVQISAVISQEIIAQNPDETGRHPLMFTIYGLPGVLFEHIKSNLGDVFKVRWHREAFTKPLLELTPTEIETHKKAIKRVLEVMKKKDLRTLLLHSISELRGLELLTPTDFQSGPPTEGPELVNVEARTLRENLEAIAKALGVKVPAYTARAASSASAASSAAAAAAARPVGSTASPAPWEAAKSGK